MNKQQVVLVNENNKRLGIAEKMKAHQDGSLHRAFSIFVFNPKKELLIQQRAKTKYHSNELWSNTVCSHPNPGETYPQAVHRRLKEEMGFDCRLKKLFHFIYCANFTNGLTENEYDCVYIGKYNGQLKPDYQEIMDYKWIGLKDLKRDMVKNPEKYSAWLGIALKRINNKQIKEILT